MKTGNRIDLSDDSLISQPSIIVFYFCIVLLLNLTTKLVI